MKTQTLFLLLFASTVWGQDTTKTGQWVRLEPPYTLYTRFGIQDFKDIRTVYYNKGRVWDSAFGADSVSFIRKSDDKTLAVNWQVVKYTEVEKESTHVDVMPNTIYPIRGNPPEREWMTERQLAHEDSVLRSMGIVYYGIHPLTRLRELREKKEFVRKELAETFAQFLDECWNDSTAVRIHIRTNEWCSMSGYPSRCGDPSHYKDYYTHRLESASAMEVMREFVKWMERK